MEVNIGDKIYVIKGDLKGTIGKILNFEPNKINAIIKPTNLDGFEDDLQIEKVHCKRYFELGDQVRVIDGKYKGLNGIVTHVDEERFELPTVKLDSLSVDINISTMNLRAKELYEEDQANA